MLINVKEKDDLEAEKSKALKDNLSQLISTTESEPVQRKEPPAVKTPEIIKKDIQPIKIEKSFSPEPGDRTPSPPSPQVVAIPVARKKTPSPPPVFSPAPIRNQKRILPNRPIPKFHFPFGKPRPRVSFLKVDGQKASMLVRASILNKTHFYCRAKRKLSYLHWTNGQKKIKNNLSVLKIWVMSSEK